MADNCHEAVKRKVEECSGDDQPEAKTSRLSKTLTDLPNELLLPIFTGFNLKDRTAVGAVCSRFYQLMREAGECPEREEFEKLIVLNIKDLFFIHLFTKPGEVYKSWNLLEFESACTVVRTILMTSAAREFQVMADFTKQTIVPFLDFLPSLSDYTKSNSIFNLTQSENRPIGDVALLLKGINSGFRRASLGARLLPSQVLPFYQGVLCSPLESLEVDADLRTTRAFVGRVIELNTVFPGGELRPQRASISTRRLEGEVYRAGMTRLALLHGGWKSEIYHNGVSLQSLTMQRWNQNGPGTPGYVRVPHAEAP